MLMQNDEKERELALDCTKSFIVQAPAGSGKTELLTQRYLTLLAHACQQPEEIIAITFTRKAAIEMKNRVFAALELAKQATAPQEMHRLKTWELAKAVLEINQTQHWRLLENPQRLQIFTIDAFLAQLIKKTPLTAGATPSCRFVEDATVYYTQATEEILKSLASNNSAALKTLLLHLENQVAKLVELCVSLLSKRDQWLPYIVPAQSNPLLLKEHMEKGLYHCVEEALGKANALFSAELKTRLFPLLKWTAWPKANPESYAKWQALANLFLTQGGEWRKKVDTRQGLPPKSAEKKQFEEILAACQDNFSLQKHLQAIQNSPPLHYKPEQWQIIAILLELLPILAAQLQSIFQQQNVMDFVELNLAASRALGEEDQPSDLNLKLDYQIKHILIDEFQDTSVMQFNLLKKLISGWQPDAERTLFLVGDPMQSIYRFRNAEVGLFFRVKQQALSHYLHIQSLQLKTNFRSSPELINWFNAIFPEIMPAKIDLATGAIPYHASLSAHSFNAATPAAATEFYFFSDDRAEAQAVTALIEQYQAQKPDNTIAVLVRSRTHLKEILLALQLKAIPFQAIDINPLAAKSEVLDLVALVRALMHRADRIAWLSLLRAPFCGLSLADLHIIAQNAEHRTIYESINQSKQLPLSADGQLRIARLLSVLQQAFLNQNRTGFANWIENTWISLGGPSGLNHLSQIENIQAFFNLLLSLEEKSEHWHLESLERELKKLYAPSQSQANLKLQIMTIHKAKGLEFDHVIVPALHKKIGVDEQALLLWLERAGAKDNDLILAPIKERAGEDDQIYRYLRQIEIDKLNHESIRLLYVAATRAKCSLDLLATVSQDENYRPPANTFLEKLWPFCLRQYHRYLQKNEIAATSENKMLVPQKLKRTPARYTTPYFLDQPISTKPLQNSSAPDFKVTHLNAKTEGIAIHEALASLANLGHQPSAAEFNALLHRLQQKYPAHIANVELALQNTLKDPRGAWILFGPHTEAKTEYGIKAYLDNQIIHAIMDRTFVDTVGIRWIIDYKTTAPELEIAEHQAQLARYARIMTLMENREIRLGLYYPLTSTWKDIEIGIVTHGY